MSSDHSSSSSSSPNSASSTKPLNGDGTNTTTAAAAAVADASTGVIGTLYINGKPKYLVIFAVFILAASLIVAVASLALLLIRELTLEAAHYCPPVETSIRLSRASLVMQGFTATLEGIFGTALAIVLLRCARYMSQMRKVTNKGDRKTPIFVA
jgi:hypothetical protein